VREETCPFCRTKNVHNARSSRKGISRVARSTLFVASAVALADCGSTATFYGGPCLSDPDACAITQNDASADVNELPMYGGPCPGGGCFDASPDSASDASSDSAPDSAADSD
jgi:hypothetical protein